MQISIVPFRREAHLDAAVQVLLRVREADSSYPPPVDVELGEESFGTWLLKDEVIVRWVAVSDGKVVGHVAVSNMHDYLIRFLSHSNHIAPGEEFYEIGKLFVDPKARRNGVGERLLSHALEFVASHRRIPALAVIDSSEAARRLYSRSALQEFGTFDGIHGTNYVFIGAYAEVTSSP